MAAALPPPPNPTDPRQQRRAFRQQSRLSRLSQPTSLLGPAALLIVGTLFLLIQLGRLSPGQVAHLAFRWSPLLLIALGLFRILEWALDRRRLRQAREDGLPFQPTRTGAGFGLLLTLLLFFSIAGAVWSRHQRRFPDRFPEGLLLGQSENWEQLFGDRHESRDMASYPCPPGSTLSIDLGHGDLTIAGTSPDDQIHLTSHTTVFSASDADAAQRARTVQPQFRTDANHLTLAAGRSPGAEVDLDVTLPAGIALTVNADHGDVAVSRLRAPATLTANHGDVTLSDMQGPVAARLNNSGSSFAAHQIAGPMSISGRVEDVTLSDVSAPVTLEGDIFGDLHLERLSGPLRLRTSRIDLELASLAGTLQAEGSGDLSADQIVGPLVINTRNRNIALEAVRGPVTVNNQNGSVAVTLTQLVAPITISNRHGEVSLQLPASSSFTADAETTDADLTNGFGLDVTTSGSSSQLRGTVGPGGPPVYIRTTQGDVAIEKSATPSAPTPPPPPAPPSARPRSTGEKTNSGEVTF